MELDNTGFGIRLIRSSHQGNIVQHWLSSVMPLQSTVAFNKLQALLAKNASWLPDAYFIFSAPYGSVDVKILGTTLNTDWVGHWVIREKNPKLQSLMVELDITSETRRNFMEELGEVNLVSALYLYEKGRGLTLP